MLGGGETNKPPCQNPTRSSLLLPPPAPLVAAFTGFTGSATPSKLANEGGFAPPPAPPVAFAPPPAPPVAFAPPPAPVLGAAAAGAVFGAAAAGAVFGAAVFGAAVAAGAAPLRLLRPSFAASLASSFLDFCSGVSADSGTRPNVPFFQNDISLYKGRRSLRRGKIETSLSPFRFPTPCSFPSFSFNLATRR